MGIPGFQKWLLGNFPQVARVQGPRFGEYYDHVAFDVNQIIHTSARRAQNRPMLASMIFRELDQVLKSCIPKKSIFFAFDGPGPLAKLTTQRKRRSQNKTNHGSDDSNGSSSKAKRNKKYFNPGFDKLEMTPGVETLQFIRDAFEYWAYSRLQNDRKYRFVDIRISSANVPGEGELKLIDFCKSSHVSPEDSIVVVGGDADIVLQGLATTNVKDFFVYLRHFGGTRRKRLNYVISVWELARILESHFPMESLGVRIDFILLSILNGNDYLPKLRGVSLSRLWKRYQYLKAKNDGEERSPFYGQTLVDSQNRTINWAFFHALIHKVGVNVPPVDVLENIKKNEEQLQTQSLQAPQAQQTPQLYIGKRRRRKMKKGYTTDTDSEFGDEVVYDGNEEGIPMSEFYRTSNWNDPENSEAVDNSEDSDSDDSDDQSLSTDNDENNLFEEDIDEDKQHIDSMIRLYGSTDKLYDTERWFQTILWTIQMYIDGYCCDYRFQYGLPYGPSCQTISEFIRSHNGEPLVIRAPVSNAPALLPHQTAMAMLPKRGVYLLPKPLQKIAKDPRFASKIYLARDMININEMIKAIDSIPTSEYASEELTRIRFECPKLLQRLPENAVLLSEHPVKKPGTKFENLRSDIPIQCISLPVTTTPPCYSWPYGSFLNMMALPYKQVGGASVRLNRTQPNQQQDKPTSKPSPSPHRQSRRRSSHSRNRSR